MKNKLKIVKFRKEDYLDDKSNKYVGFVKNQQQKNKQIKYNKPSVEYIDKDTKTNLIVDKSNLPNLTKQNTKLADDYKLNFVTLKKYNSDFDISDNQQFFQSSLKKNIVKMKIAMPKEYKPQQTIFTKKNSLFNIISKKQAQIKVEQIFQLPLMQQIMGRGESDARQLKITPLKDLNIDQISSQKRYNKKEIQRQRNIPMAPVNQNNKFQSKQFKSPSKISQISAGKKMQKINKNNVKANGQGYQKQYIEGSKHNNRNYERQSKYYEQQIIQQLSSSQEYDQIQHKNNLYYNLDYKNPIQKQNQIFNKFGSFNLPIYHENNRQHQRMPQIKYNQNEFTKRGHMMNQEQKSDYYLHRNREHFDDLQCYNPNFVENKWKDGIIRNQYGNQMMAIQNYQPCQYQGNDLFYNQANNQAYVNANLNNNIKNQPQQYVYKNFQNQRIPYKRNKSFHIQNNSHLNHPNQHMNYFPSNQYEQNMIQESKYKYIQPLQQYFIDSSQSQQTQNYYQEPNPKASKNIHKNINRNINKTQYDNKSKFIPKQAKSQYLFNNGIQEQYQYKN